MPIFTINSGISSDSGSAGVQKASKEVGSAEMLIDTYFAGGSVNEPQSVTFTTAGLKAFVLLSDQNMTIRTNSPGSPADTLDLVAGIPMVWQASGGYFRNPFTTNVTAFFISCAVAARLKGKLLVA